MQIEGRNKLVKLNGWNVDDIAKCMVDVYNRYWRTCEEIAPPLRGANEYETCKNVWQYVIDHTQYKEDNLGTQFVKSPARLLHDVNGDCKSMSVLVASLLTCLGIKCSFRFVGYKGGGNKHHVFVITQNGLNVDPVEWFQRGHNFNEQTKFNTYMDKPLNAGLAILSGVDSDSSVAMDGSVCVNNTYALNYLYAALDCAVTKAQFDPTPENINNANFLYEAKELYRSTRGNKAKMRRAGRVLQQMDTDGQFAATDDLDKLNNIADTLLGDNKELQGGSVDTWWHDNVEVWDYMAHPDDTKKAVQRIGSISIGGTSGGIAVTPDNLPDRIKQTGVWYIYGDLSAKALQTYSRKMPNLRVKALGQRLVKKGCRVSCMDLNINAATYDQLAQSGLLTQTKGRTADAFLRDVWEGGEQLPAVSGGMAASEIVKMIAMILTAVATAVGIVISVLQFNQGKKMIEKYYDTSAADEIEGAIDNMDEYSASEEDFDALYNKQTNKQTKAGISKVLIFVLLGFLLLKK